MGEGGQSTPDYRLYSRWQVELATVLGSPIAGALLLRANFRRLGNPRAGRWAVPWGIAATAAVLALAVVVENRGMPRRLVSGLVQAVFVSAAYGVFQHWFQASLLAHKAAGGRTGPWWHALAAVLGAFAILALPIGGFFAAAAFGPASILDRVDDCVTFTRLSATQRERVCFREGATQADARELGEDLRKRGVFTGTHAFDVYVERPSGKRVVSLIVTAHGFQSADVARAVSILGEEMSATTYRGQRLELRLCREEECAGAKTVFASK